MNTLRMVALLLLRWAVGVIFFYHGFMKLTHLHLWATQAFPHMGFPGYFAYIAAALETGGGALLIVGLGARVVGLLLAGEMTIALLKVHLLAGPITYVPRYELVMLLAAASFAICAFGAGPLALDAKVGGRKRGR